MMMSEEKVIERVTAPSSKVKNTKKVAAGKAGAAARKAKHEKLLAELRDVKAEHSIKEPAEPELPPPEPQPMEAKTDWAPWAIGGLGMVGVVWLFSKQCRRRPAVSPQAPAEKEQCNPHIADAGQFKGSANPFHME